MDATERRKRASTEAADWWALLQDDAMTRAQREAFIDWLRDSQTHVAEMLRLAQVHGVLEQFREWSDISTDRPLTEDHGNVVTLPLASPPIATEAHARTPSRVLRRFALAATLAAIAVFTAIFLPQFRGQWIVTDRGERREVVLDDGSVVQVDPQTRLHVRFEKSQRRVVLSEGRAVFRVAKNPDRPFWVEAGDTTVRAVGTAFGVDRRVRDHVVVTVAEGKVAVLPSESDETGQIFLTANEQITVAMTTAPQPIRVVDSQRELAWSEGRLVFRNDTVASVVAEFNRYNRVQLTVTDPALAARPVTGVFDASNPEGFLAFLQSAAHVHIERNEGRSIVISPSESP